jgi:thioredoxin-like negative regulator of GroEL
MLETEDFDILTTDKAKHLVHTFDSKFSITMFYTDECDQCNIIKPILLRYIGHPTIQICMVNVYDDDSVKLIEMSADTTTPLRHVPLIIFYVNGTPFKKFDGQYTSQDFAKFVTDVLQEAASVQNIAELSDIPAYTIGKPNSAKVCYLTFQKAY